MRKLIIPTGYVNQRSRFRIRGFVVVVLFCCLFAFTSVAAFAQATTFAGNAQHTSIYPVPAQTLNTIKWSTSIDFNNTTLAHYGAPLITSANTVLVPVKTASNGFRVDAFSGANGALKYVTSSDYILPTHNWVPVYNPCVTTGSFGTRMYYAGAGGTIWHIDDPDSNTPGVPVREVFYTSLAGYNANAAAYNSSIFVNSPITADAAGNIYFGFRVQGTAPAPLNTTQSGVARIDANGNGIYVLAGVAANDASTSLVSHNLAPALSNDGNTLYVVVKSSDTTIFPYLLGLNATTLATEYLVTLKDPRNGNPARVPDDGTASPMVAPDGDVYFGVLVTNNGSRGFLLRFSGDLTVTKTPGAFGWDYTPGIVPASMVPSYTGPSPYLLFTKYNDYPFADGTGVNRVAILDPNVTQIDPHSSASGLVEMREVMTVIGPTPDPDPNPSIFPYAVKEWCINAPAINPSTNSVFFTSEDGRSYRWNLTTNTLDQSVVLTPGILEPYVPTVIGPDGTVYTQNGGTFFALGNVADVNVTLSSSAPDMRNVVVGSPITFTATVTGSAPAPTGTVTFTDFTYNGLTPVATTLASGVPLNGGGQAAFTTSALEAGGGFRGSHFITATYSGDANHSGSAVTMVQKVHASASTLALVASPNPSNFGQTVTFTATVSSLPAGGGTPSGMITFQDGAIVIGQAPLNPSGVAFITRPNLAPGSHNIVATYASDTLFAASSAGLTQVVQIGTSTAVTSSSNPSSFGQLVTFTATVTPPGGAPGTPTGSVTFTEGTTVLANVPLDGTGQASFSTSSLSIGSHTITAEFNGTNGWLNSSGSVAQQVQDAPPPVPTAPGQILISEFRFSGPGAVAGGPLGLIGSQRDEFIELYNNTDTDLSIDGLLLRSYDPNFFGPGDGADFVQGFDPGTVIPARGHFLVGDSSAYSLSSYALLELDTLPLFNGDFFIDNEGIQVISGDAVPVIFDSVGFTGSGGRPGETVNYLEGTGLSRRTQTAPAVQYSYVRRMTGGTPQDTNDNVADFALISVTASAFSLAAGGTTQSTLGGPGPENTQSPTQKNAVIKPSLIDPGVSATVSPNRVRDSTPGSGATAFGTLLFRRKFTNTASEPVNVIRWRIVDITTLGGITAGQADLRAIASASPDFTVSVSAGGTVPVKGTQVEQPPDQSLGGGLNSSIVTITSATPIVPGASVNIELALGVAGTGSFRFFINTEGEISTPVQPNKVVRAAASERSAKAGANNRRAFSPARKPAPQPALKVVRPAPRVGRK